MQSQKCPCRLLKDELTGNHRKTSLDRSNCEELELFHVSTKVNNIMMGKEFCLPTRKNKISSSKQHSLEKEEEVESISLADCVLCAMMCQEQVE